MKLKRTLKTLLIGAICIFESSLAQQPALEFNPPVYIAQKATSNIVIDGDGGDLPWNKADWSDLFIDIQGIDQPKYDTKVKMLWDDQYWYILASIEEPHVWATIKNRDEIIYHDNDFEVFVDPDGDTYHYYELELNALNTLWDLYISKPYREQNRILNDWTMTGLKSAIKINGTLNNPNDIDQGWMIEMAIPWDLYKTSYFEKVYPEDEFWRINFSRVNWDFELENNSYTRKKDSNGKLLPEYNWVWSPTGEINIHIPEKWGYLYFASSVESGAKFKIPFDEKIKWQLFDLYRYQKTYFHNNKKWSKELPYTSVLIDEHQVHFTIEHTTYGWTITASSPISDQTYLIQHQGQLLTLN